MIYNFSAGPAVLPKEVLQQAAAEMLDWHGSGMSVMEMSHRGPEFSVILAEALADLRELLAVPESYEILFMQGGAIAENALVPLNLAGLSSTGQPATFDYVCTGSWSLKSIKEAGRYGHAHVAADMLATAGDQQSAAIPDRAAWQLSQEAVYVHICANETIDGIEYQNAPEVTAPLVADMSSSLLSRVINVADYGVIYAGAQKNIGPAGLTIVIVRKDLLGYALPHCPSAFNWQTVASHGSMYNTPPTYAIYIAGLVFKWLKRRGGVAVMEQVNIAKAKLLYDYLDASTLFENRVRPDCRSRMNIPFFLRDEALNQPFLKAAGDHGLLQLKGHSSVGGMRASVYNAMPIEGVQALVSFMQEFELLSGLS